MPTCLVTWSPPATRPGLLARAGPEPSPGGVQGPHLGPGAPGANTPATGSMAEQKETPRQTRSCQVDATTGFTGVPARCSAASTAGPATRGPPASPQPLSTARPRPWGALESPKVWELWHRYQPAHTRTLPAARRASSAHVCIHGCWAQKSWGQGLAEQAGSSPTVMPGELRLAGSCPHPYSGHSKAAAWPRRCCRQLPSPTNSPPQGEEAGERVPVPSGGTSGCDAVIANASGLIYGDEKMFPGFPQSPIKIPVPLYF